MTRKMRNRLLTIITSIIASGLLVASTIVVISDGAFFDNRPSYDMDVSELKAEDFSLLPTKIMETIPESKDFQITPTISFTFDDTGKLTEGLMNFQTSNEDDQIKQYQFKSSSESSTAKIKQTDTDESQYVLTTKLSHEVFVLVSDSWTDIESGLQVEYESSGISAATGLSLETGISGTISNYLYQDGNIVSVESLNEGSTYYQLDKIVFDSGTAVSTERYFLPV